MPGCNGECDWTRSYGKNVGKAIYCLQCNYQSKGFNWLDDAIAAHNKVARAVHQRNALLAMLIELEWSGKENLQYNVCYTICSVCKRRQSRGHHSNCKLGNLLKSCRI